MSGASNKSQPVIDLLNEVLTSELTAINQYFLHAELCQHWGLSKLGKKIRMNSIGEMKHAEELIERVLFLDGLPNVQRLGRIRIGENVTEILESDLSLEKEAIERLTSGIKLCADANDHGSRLLLEKILASEEEHIDWIDAQKKAIEQVGLENYLTTQIE